MDNVSMAVLNQGRIIRLDDFGQTFVVLSCYASQV